MPVLGVETRHDLGRSCPPGRSTPAPSITHEALDAGSSYRRHRPGANSIVARPGRLREDLQLPGLVVRDHRRGAERADLHRHAATRSVRSLAAAVVRLVRELDPGDRRRTIPAEGLRELGAVGREPTPGRSRSPARASSAPLLTSSDAMHCSGARRRASCDHGARIPYNGSPALGAARADGERSSQILVDVPSSLMRARALGQDQGAGDVLEGADRRRARGADRRRGGRPADRVGDMGRIRSRRPARRARSSSACRRKPRRR